MSNLSPTILEFSLLVVGLIAVATLAIVGKLPVDQAITLIMTIIGYGIGVAKGASTINAIQSATNANVVTSSQPGVSAASPQAANTTDATK